MRPQSKERSGGVTSIRKRPPEGADGFAEYQIEQQSGSTQYEKFLVRDQASAAAQVYLGYRRCGEFDKGNQPGQDYAVVRVGGGYVVGVVADGVSRSFYGNLAAEYVSTWLIDELWQQRTATPDQESMESLLKDVEGKFADFLKEYRIPSSVPPYLQQILELRRAKGSQTVLAAFVLEVARAQVTLYQIGNVKALIHNSNPEPKVVEAPDAGRWSSAGKSPLLLKKTVFENVAGIVIKTDGVSEEWGRTLDEAALDRDRFNVMTETRCLDDDVSFIAVRYSKVPAQAASDAEALPVQTPAQQPVSAFAGPLSGASMTEDHNGKTSAGPDGLGVDDRKNDSEGKVRPRKEAAPSGTRRTIKIFMAGVAVGTALTLSALILTRWVSSRRQITQKPPGPDAAANERTVDGDGGNIAVETKSVEQIGFQKAYASSFPPLIKGNPITAIGEIIAHVSVEGASVGGVELALNKKESATVERARVNGGGPSFFLRLNGLSKPTPVTIRILDPNGNVICEIQENMRGREKKEFGKDPFLGYYEIYVRRLN